MTDDFDLDGLRPAAELYGRDGTPCATCTCSFMSMRPGRGTSLGFDAGAGLTLRVCRKGREPLVAEGGTGALWCEDFKPFSEIVPIPADDLDRLRTECSRGFVGDLAQGLRPLPRGTADLRWYDRGLREGWLPPHRIETSGHGAMERIGGPWDQFVVVGVTPAFGDGHTPAVGEPVLQAKDRRTYLLPESLDAEEARGAAQHHAWWVGQVGAGAAIPLERPLPARRGAVPLVLRGGETVLSPHALKYLDRDGLDAALDALADEALVSARGALRRKNPVVAGLCVRQGLRARPAHAGLRALQAELA